MTYLYSTLPIYHVAEFIQSKMGLETELDLLQFHFNVWEYQMLW